MTPDALARACADAMWAADRASPALGMAIEAVGPGWARMSMPVRADMVNGHGTCHGGFIFALADSAFAFACNTDGMASVAQACSVNFLAPAHAGDVLLAEADVRHAEGRSGLYDVRVRAGAQVVAEFRGLSRTTGRRLLPDAG